MLGVPIGRGRIDVAGNGFDQEVLDLLVDVLPLKDPTPLLVDDQTLPVHDVVVLQDVLADLEVLRLDLGLR